MIGRIGMERFQQMWDRVAGDASSALVSHYAQGIFPEGKMRPKVIRSCVKQVTGEKCLVNPTSSLLVTKLLVVFAPATYWVTGEI